MVVGRFGLQYWPHSIRPSSLAVSPSLQEVHHQPIRLEAEVGPGDPQRFAHDAVGPVDPQQIAAGPVPRLARLGVANRHRHHVVVLPDRDGLGFEVQVDVAAPLGLGVQLALERGLVNEIHLGPARDRARGPVNRQQLLPVGIEPAIDRRRSGDLFDDRSQPGGVQDAMDLVVDADRTRQRIDLVPPLEHADAPAHAVQQQGREFADRPIADLDHVEIRLREMRFHDGLPRPFLP